MCHKVKFVVPRFSETADKRFAQEFIDWQTEFHTLPASRRADVPMVVVDGGECLVFSDADGIQRARYWLLEAVCKSLAVGFVDDAQRGAVGSEAAEHALFADNDRQHEFALSVMVADSLIVNNLLGLWGKAVEQDRHDAFYGFHFRVRYRRALIAFDAAGTLAARKVAAKTAFDDIEADDGVMSDLKHCDFILLSAKLG